MPVGAYAPELEKKPWPYSAGLLLFFFIPYVHIVIHGYEDIMNVM